MASEWFLQENEVEIGPLSESQFVAMAKAGRISPTDLVRNKSMTTPLPAGRIKGLFPDDEPSVRSEANPATKAGAVLKEAGETVSRLARIKSIELNELPNAEFALGKKAIENGFSSPETAEILLAIRDLEDEIKQLRENGNSVDEHATLADRANNVAQNVRTKFSVEALIQRRKQKVIELGSVIRANPRVGATQTLSQEIKLANSLSRELEKLRDASRKAGPLTKLKRYCTAIGVLALLVWAAWTFRGLIFGGDQTADRHGLRIGEFATTQKAEPTPQELAMLERERELEARRLKLAEEKAQKQAERELALREKALRDEEARIAAEEAEAQLREVEEARKAAEAERLAKEAATLKAESEKEAAMAQETRKQLAESLFTPLSLDPSRYITLSSKLTNMGVSLEIRGEKVPQIDTLLKSKDYLGLINFFQATEVTEYPDAAIIRTVHQQLLNTPFVILVKSEKPLKVDRRTSYLLHVRFYESDNISIAGLSYRWNTHPDGIGLLGEWKLAYGPTILCYGDYRQYLRALSTLKSGIVKALDALQAKQNLGEVSQAVVDERRRELVIEAQAKVRTASLAL